MIVSLLCAASLLYFCKTPPYGGVVMIPSVYVVLVIMLLYELAELNATSENTLMLLSAVRFGECSTQNQMIKMMEYNGVHITCAGIVITYRGVNAMAVGGFGLLCTTMVESFLENGAWNSLVGS